MSNLKAYNFGDWGRKYRPQMLEEMILPAAIKKVFITIRDRQAGPHLLLIGPHGSGKTTAAMLMAPSKERMRFHLTEAASNYNSLHNAILSQPGDWQSNIRNVALIDHADKLKPAVQLDLLKFIESLAPRNMYIVTANEPLKLAPAIRDRLIPVDFAKMNGDPDLREQMLDRAKAILDQEQVKLDAGVVRSIVHRHFPNMYKVLEQLQYDAMLA